MINNATLKNKDELIKNKLSIEQNNNKINYIKKPNIIQVIKKKEINISDFDPMKHKRALLNLQNPKKVVNKKDSRKEPLIKKNVFHFFGPYNRLINGGGGFCKRLHNRNYNLNLIYELFPQNFPKYKLNTEKNDIGKMNISSNGENNNYKKNEKRISKVGNILIQENIYDNENNNKYNVTYNLRNNKKGSLDKKYKKINIKDVNKSIKDLKLDDNLRYNIYLTTKENTIKNNHDKNLPNNTNYKKIQTEKKNKKIIFYGMDKNKSKLIKKLILNETPTQTENSEEHPITERIFIKDSIEQFSVNNKKIKKFNNLIEDDSILLKFSPIKKDKFIDFRNLSGNYTISSNYIEYKHIKKIKFEPENKKKFEINTNELVILSSNSKREINDNKDNNLAEPKPNENEIISKEKEEIESKMNLKKGNNIIKNENEELKEILNKNDKNIDKSNEKENENKAKKDVDKFAKFKERLKRKNEANKKKIEDKPNKIKNLALELESKMLKKDKDNENEVKTQNKNNDTRTKNEVDYNIPVIPKKKMKKKVFVDN